MVKGTIPDLSSEDTEKETSLSCTFCGAGTWATWEVVTDDGVIFACDRHHVQMSQAKMIRLEKMRGKEAWNKISTPKQISYEEYVDDFKDDYE
jgi:hypothetical protein